MIFELLLLIFIIYIAFSSGLHTSRPILSMLEEIGRNVCEDIKYPTPQYVLKNSNPIDGSLTIFKHNTIPIIKICTTNANNTPFDRDTILIAFLHELTHVLLPDDRDHSPQFYDLEDTLLDSAMKLGYLGSTSQIDSCYPCKHS